MDSKSIYYIRPSRGTLKGTPLAWIIGSNICGFPIWCWMDVAGTPSELGNADGHHISKRISNDLNTSSRV